MMKAVIIYTTILASAIQPAASRLLYEEFMCGREDDLGRHCPNNLCCSKFGFCGDSELHCGDGCQSGQCIQNDGPRCGAQGDGALCEEAEAPCCSQYGYCGTNKAYCGGGCQSGNCWYDRGTIFNYCGVNWYDANAVCGKACPYGGDDECPDDSKCFADAYNCDPVDDIDPPPVPCPPAELDPTLAPTLSPTLTPVWTAKPTRRPSTPYPTKYPTKYPTVELDPTLTPTLSPSLSPVLTAKPTRRPSTPYPTKYPTKYPTVELDPTLTPTLSPTISPVLTAKPTKRPSTPYPTKYPTSPPISDYRCGKDFGNVVCPNDLCCSSHGYCGSTAEYCGEGCQSNCFPIIQEPEPSLSPTLQPTLQPTLSPSLSPTNIGYLPISSKPTRRPTKKPHGGWSKPPPPTKKPSHKPVWHSPPTWHSVDSTKSSKGSGSKSSKSSKGSKSSHDYGWGNSRDGGLSKSTLLASALNANSGPVAAKYTTGVVGVIILCVIQFIMF